VVLRLFEFNKHLYKKICISIQTCRRDSQQFDQLSDAEIQAVRAILNELPQECKALASRIKVFLMTERT
jgi:hypothetical protein